MNGLADVTASADDAVVKDAESAKDKWSDNWNETFAAARTDGKRPILIKYEASWCGPCKMLTEEMHTADIEPLLDGFHLLRIDVDKPPAGADVEGISSLPTMRVVTGNGEIIHQQVGLIQGDSLSTWLSQCESVYQEIVRRRKFASRLSSGVLDDTQVDLLLEMLQDRSATQRSTATELLVRHPQLVAGKVIELLSATKMRSRVAALDVLRRWPAPIEGIDPWDPDSVTEKRIGALKSWAKTVVAEKPSQTDNPKVENAAPDNSEPDKPEVVAQKPSAEAIAEAGLEIDRLLRRGPVREGLIDGLAVVGPELLPGVKSRLETETSDTARERLSAVQYRLIASPTLSIRLPGATDKLASLDSSPRRIAAQLLSEQAQKDDVPLLQTLFAHNDPLIRELALRGLQKSGGGEATELVRFLKDPDKNVRAAVLKLWLDNPRSSLALPISKHALIEKDPGLLVYYVRLLKEIKSSKDEVFDALGKLAEHDDWQVRAEVAAAISHYTEEQNSSSNKKVLKLAFREPARNLLKDSDSFVLSKIVPAIIEADQKASFDQLLQVAWKYPEIRNSVLPKLSGTHHDEDNVKFLIKRFESEDADSRHFALEALSRLRVQKHEEYLRKGFDDKDPEVQLAAVRGLNSWLDTYHSKLPVLPGAPQAAYSGNTYDAEFDIAIADDPFGNPEPAGSVFLEALGSIFGGGAKAAEVTPEAEATPKTEEPADSTPTEDALPATDEPDTDEPADDEAADDATKPAFDPENLAVPDIQGDPADAATDGETEQDDSDDTETDDTETYEQWLAKWRESPSAVLPWLDGVDVVVQRLYESDDPVTKAHASLAALRLAIEITPQEVIDSVSALPDSNSRLEAAYRWLPRESRGQLLFFSAKSEEVDDYFPAVVEAARVYDKPTIESDSWKALDMVDAQHVHSGYYLRRTMMQVMTGKTYFNSQSKKATAKIADRLEKHVTSTKSDFARKMGLSLMGDIDSDRLESLVGKTYEDTTLDDAVRRDWARMALGSSKKPSATSLAVGWLQDETFLDVALDFLAQGHSGIAATELGSIQVPDAAMDSYSYGKLSVPSVDPIVKADSITPLLDHKDPKVVARATYLLIVMGQDVDIAPLEKMVRSEGIGGYLSGWTDLFVMAIAMRNNDADVTVLEEILAKVGETDYGAQQFYWKIRIMTGPRALKMRKQMREKYGMDNLL